MGVRWRLKKHTIVRMHSLVGQFDVLQALLLLIQTKLVRQRVILIEDVESFETTFLFEHLKSFVFGGAGEHATSRFVVRSAIAILHESLAQHLVVVMWRGTHQGISVRLIYQRTQ